MLRYFAIATFVVLSVAVAATAWSYRDLIRIRIASTNLRVPPRGDVARRERGASAGTMGGDAPWALSALPECFTQQSSARGSRAFVQAHLPGSAVLIARGTTLRYGPCTIFVGDGEALVQRGADRLRIPPFTRLYRAGNRLVLYRTAGASADLRTYTASNDTYQP